MELAGGLLWQYHMRRGSMRQLGQYECLPCSPLHSCPTLPFCAPLSPQARLGSVASRWRQALPRRHRRHRARRCRRRARRRRRRVRFLTPARLGALPIACTVPTCGLSLSATQSCNPSHLRRKCRLTDCYFRFLSFIFSSYRKPPPAATAAPPGSTMTISPATAPHPTARPCCGGCRGAFRVVVAKYLLTRETDHDAERLLSLHASIHIAHACCSRKSLCGSGSLP